MMDANKKTTPPEPSRGGASFSITSRNSAVAALAITAFSLFFVISSMMRGGRNSGAALAGDNRVPNAAERPQRLLTDNTTSTIPLIVGGTAAPAGVFPFSAVSIYSNIAICGGSLIYKDIILTAAHCEEAWNATGQVAFIGNTLVSGSDGEKIPVDSVLKNPGFNPTNFKNDIMLVKLKNNSTKTPVILETKVTSPKGQATVTAIGFGDTTENGFISNVLLEVNLTTIDYTTCKNYWENPNSFTPVSDTNQICAGDLAGGKDTCQGDSGGPLLFKNVQVAITSFSDGCARVGVPGVYTRVAAYSQFIQQGICTLSSDPPASCSSGTTPTKSPSSTAKTANPTRSSTASLSPTKSPASRLIHKCLKKAQRGCNCGLFFRGSRCPQGIIQTICKRPPQHEMRHKTFQKAVLKEYDQWCRA